MDIQKEINNLKRKQQILKKFEVLEKSVMEKKRAYEREQAKLDKLLKEFEEVGYNYADQSTQESS